VSAKRKLNSAYFTGCLAIAGLCGVVTESFAVFVIAFLALLLAAFHSRDIRR
jgi:hypothetical protein